MPPRVHNWTPDVPRTERSDQIVPMTIIKINAITVPEDAGDELARRFAARAGAVDGQDGFEGFELFRPTDERNQWLVLTRWRDEEAFQNWVASPAFAHGHAGADRPSPHGGPVAVSSELWSYEVAGGSVTSTDG
jgi:heme-degrading monooxygenase HmoA